MPTDLSEVETGLRGPGQETNASNLMNDARKSSSRSKIRYLVLVLVIAAAAVGIDRWIEYNSNRESTDDAQVDGHIIPIASKISGNVLEVLINDNEQIRSGQVLLRIDPRDYQAKLDQAKAALALAESQARAAGVGVPLTRKTTQSGISSAQAQLAGAQAEYERAKLVYDQAATADMAAAKATVDSKQASSDRAQADLARMKALLEKEEISKLQFDAFQSAALVAASELKAAQEKLSSITKDADIKRAALASAKAHVDMAQADMEASTANLRKTEISHADVGSATAAIAVERANLQAAELQAGYTTVVAPDDGVVTRKTVEVGQIVQPGQALLSIVPLHKVWVTANFKETQLATMRSGQKAEIHIDTYGKTFAGRVSSIAGATGARLSLLPPENASGNFVKVVQRIPVKILVDPIAGDQVLRPGMNVVVTVITQ